MFGQPPSNGACGRRCANTVWNLLARNGSTERRNSHLPGPAVQHCMAEETGHVPAHVPVTELWSYTSGTANLTDNDFEHLLFCVACQSLLDEFIDIQDNLPSEYRKQAA